MIFLEIQMRALRGESILLLNLIYSVIRSDYYISLLCSRANPSNSLSIHMHLLSSSSVQFSHSVTSSSLPPRGLQHARLPCLSPAPGACLNLCPLSQWCHPTILSSVIPFSSCLQSFQASGSFLISWLFEWWPKYWGFSFSISTSNEYSGLIIPTSHVYL